MPMEIQSLVWDRQKNVAGFTVVKNNNLPSNMDLGTIYTYLVLIIFLTLLNTSLCKF